MNPDVRLIVKNKIIAVCRMDELSILLADIADDDTVESVTVEFVK